MKNPSTSGIRKDLQSSNEIIVVAIAGGSGSGKTTLAKKLAKILSESSESLPILGQDSYYIDQSSRFDHDGGLVNFDHPEALEFSLLAEHLRLLKKGMSIEVPIYEFSTHKRLTATESFKSQKIVILEGTLILSQPELVQIIDESIFLKVPEALRFQRRMKRDVEERGRSEEGVREQFFQQVKPMHDRYVEPSMREADILLQDQEILTMSERGSKIRQLLIDALNKHAFTR